MIRPYSIASSKKLASALRRNIRSIEPCSRKNRSLCHSTRPRQAITLRSKVPQMRKLHVWQKDSGTRKRILSVKLMQSLSEGGGMRDDLEMIAICGATEAQMIGELLKKNGIESTLQGNVSANVLPLENDFDEVRIWV